MTSNSSEYSSLLNKDDQNIKQTKSNKCRNYGIISLLLLILSGVVVYYATNSKIISNGNILSSQNAITTTSEKPNKIIVTRENIDLNKIAPKIKLSDNNEINVKITQFNSHVLKAHLYHEKENRLTMFEFNVDKQEIEIAMYKDKNFKNLEDKTENIHLKQESRVEYFKTSKDTNTKGKFTYQYNEEIISLTKEKKKDEEFQQKGFKQMNSFIQSWTIPSDLVLLSIKVGGYGLTGKSSHAVRYLHSIASHFYTLQENVKYPDYFTNMVQEVNDHVLSNKNQKISKEWFWSSSSDEDYDFTVGDTGSDCAADEDNECFVSDTCWVDSCTIDDRCDNECFGLCGKGCSCWSWVCGDCDCHCLCKLHDYWCSCSFWGFLDSCCYNVWYWVQGCCA